MLSNVPEDRLARAHVSLEGLSVGDAFGEQFFKDEFGAWALGRVTPPGPWPTTDDTEMAISIVNCLERDHHINQTPLSRMFASRFMADPYRGYGPKARKILAAIHAGKSWREAAPAVFGGEGSCGNGSAMRVAPLGAYFADSPELIPAEAVLSAEITHAHPEGKAGAIAVAMAAAWTWHGGDLFDFVLPSVPAGEVRDGIIKARGMLGASAEAAAKVLGNGSKVTCQDTVPFCLWVAAQFLDNYQGAVWTTATAGGDRDTTSAIVGGILAGGHDSVSGAPHDWRHNREPLRFTDKLPN